MLDLATKASIRRHLGIPAAGTNTGGATLGLRAVTRAGQLEYYMNQLQLEEEAIILGRPYGSIALYDPLTVGDDLHITVTVGSNSPVVYDYTVQSGDKAADVAQRIAAQLSNLLPGFTTQGGALPPFAQISLMSVVGTFVLTAVSKNGVNPGTTNITVLAFGTNFPSPQYQVSDGNGIPANAVIAYGILPVCDALEQQLLNASQNLSYSNVGSTATGGAAFRPDELIVRSSLLQRYRHELGVMLGFYQPDSVSMIPSFGIEI